MTCCCSVDTTLPTQGEEAVGHLGDALLEGSGQRRSRGDLLQGPVQGDDEGEEATALANHRRRHSQFGTGLRGGGVTTRLVPVWSVRN